MEITLLPPEPSGELAAASPRHSQRHLVDLWAEDLRARAAAGSIAARTKDGYKNSAAGWLAFLDQNGIEHPGPGAVREWVAALHGSGLKPSTISTRLAAVKALYRWAEEKEFYPSIARSVKGPKVQKDSPLDCLSAEAVAGLLELIPNGSAASLRNAALIHVLFSTACRLVSLHGANVGDFDRETGEIIYQGKGDQDKGRRAFLGKGSLVALCHYLEEREAGAGGVLDPGAPLFVAVGNRAGGNRLTTRSMRRVVIGLMEQAGHVSRNGEGHIRRPGIYTAHSLRRSSITAAVDAAGLEAGQTLAGHADSRTTRRAYARVKKGEVLRELAGVLDLTATATTDTAAA